MAFRCLAHNKRNAKAKICIQIHLCVEPNQTKANQNEPNRSEPNRIELSRVELSCVKTATVQNSNLATVPHFVVHDKHCLSVCVCACYRILSIWVSLVSGLRWTLILILIRTLKSGFCLFVHSSVCPFVRLSLCPFVRWWRPNQLSKCPNFICYAHHKN